jgi:hypothetical protein
MADLIYRTTGAWGAGKGGNLTPAEVDGNFYELANRAAAALAITPAEIDTITASGTQLTITLTDARVFTVTVPVAAPYSRVATKAGTTATLVLVDAWSYLQFTNDAGCTVTVPTDAQLDFVVGTEIRLMAGRNDAPVILDSQDNAVVLNAPESATFPLSTREGGSVITIKKIAADVWDVYGDLAGTGGGGGGGLESTLAEYTNGSAGATFSINPVDYGTRFVLISNTGAFTISGSFGVNGENNADMYFLIDNQSTAGAVTFATFFRVTGDAITTTDGHAFLVRTTRIANLSYAHVTAQA